MSETYTIPAANLPRLTEQVLKLNRRVRRLGVPEIRLTSAPAFVEREYRFASGDERRWVAEDGESLGQWWTPTGRVREWLSVTVEGEAPRFAGWTLTGVLEPLATEDGTENIVRAVPGHAVPAEYRDRVGQCDHCHTVRRRTETFAVQHEDGRTCMVGRQCLRDFLGHADPHHLAAMAELLCQLGTLCRDAGSEDWMGGGCRQPDAWTLDHVLAVTSAVVRREGWTSATKARECQWMTSTRSHVDRFLRPVQRQYRSRDDQDWLDAMTSEIAEPAHVQAAEAAIEWTLAIEPDSDYLYNVNLIARAGYVTDKTLGLAVSIIAAWRRATNQELEGRRPKVVSQHVGQIGKRVEMTVTCDQVISVDGNYGSTGIHKLVDEAGNRLTWFASSSASWLDEGKTYRIKATPKQHGSWKGSAETTVTRVSVVEEMELASKGE